MSLLQALEVVGRFERLVIEDTTTDALDPKAWAVELALKGYRSKLADLVAAGIRATCSAQGDPPDASCME